MTCPRCLLDDVQGHVCRSCRLSYDSDAAYDIKSPRHWEIRHRWDRWREQDRTAHEAKRVAAFLGNPSRGT